MIMCVPLLQMLGFLNTLCGFKASELNVKDKEKYNFDPKKLLSQIAFIILRVWAQEGSSKEFVISFATHPEYSEPAIGRWSGVLQRHGLLDPRSQQQYSNFLAEVQVQCGMYSVCVVHVVTFTWT